MTDIAQTFGWTDQIALWIMRAVLAVSTFYMGRKVTRWLSELLANRYSGKAWMKCWLVWSEARPTSLSWP